MAEHDGGIVTTNLVLVELGNFLSATGSRRLFVPFVRDIEEDSRIKLLFIDSALTKEGLTLYSRREDKLWSLTDCISFVVMQQQNLTDALTGDHHFEQAGFKALLK